MPRSTSTHELSGVLGAALLAIASTQCGTGAETPETTTYPTLGSSPDAVWSEPLGGTAATVASVAAAPDDTIRVAGSLNATATIGASVLASAGGTDVLIAKLGPDGGVLWAHGYGDSANQVASAVAVDAKGDTLITGTFAGTLDLSKSNEQVLQAALVGKLPTAAGGSALHAQGITDGFVAELDPLGRLLWATAIGGAGTSTVLNSVAVSSDGRVVVGGSYVGAAALLGGALPATTTPDAFTVALDASGAVLWAYPSNQGTAASAIGLDAQDDVLVAGGNGEAAFLSKLTATGKLAWTEALGIVSGNVSLAVDPGGDAVVLTGGVARDPTPVRSVAGSPIHVVKYDPRGNVLWSTDYGAGAVAGDALAIDGAGNAYVAGRASATFPFGQCTIAPAASNAPGKAVAAQGSAIFLGRIAPDGTATCAATYATRGFARIQTLSPATSGNVVLGGTFEDSLDLGQGPMQAAKTTAFVAQENAVFEPLQ